MSRKIKILLIIFFILFAAYSAAWYTAMSTITEYINAEYAGRDLKPEIHHQEKDEDGTLTSSFSISDNPTTKLGIVKASAVGFPFKWAIAIDGFHKVDNNNRINFQSPVILGYNLINQSIYANYKGDIIIKEKDVITKRIEEINCNSSIRMVITPDLIKTLTKTTNTSNKGFELINYFGIIKLNLQNLKWYDGQRTEKYYDLDHINLELNFDKPFYYTNLNDFINHPPQNISIYQSTRFNEDHFDKSHSLNNDEELKDFTDLIKKPSASKVKLNIKNKDVLEFYLTEFSYEVPDLIKTSLKGLLKIDKKNKNFQTKLRSEHEIGKNYFKILKTLFNDEVISAYWQKNSIFNELKFVLDHEKNFYLDELENRKYILELDGESKNVALSTQLDINHFILSSGNTSIQLKNNALYSNDSWKARGILSLTNFPKLIDISSGYLLRISQLFDWSDKSQKIITDIAKNLLKTIADHPESKANDLSVSYDLDSTNLAKGKIGNVKFNQLENLYYLALYKAVGNSIKLDDKIINKLNKIIPGFDQQLNKISPDQNILNEIIKKPKKLFNKNMLKQITE